MANWICRICSSANPEGVTECFVCGYVRDEVAEREERLAAEAAAREAERLAALEEARAREAERLRLAEVARRAEADRLRRAEEARLAAEARRRLAEDARRAADERARSAEAARRAEEERRRAAEERARAAEVARRAEEERRRRLASDTVRERAIARERNGVNLATHAFRVAFFLSIGAFVVAAIFSVITLSVNFETEALANNIAEIYHSLCSLPEKCSETLVDTVPPRFILRSDTKEALDLMLGDVSRHATELWREYLPEVLGSARDTFREVGKAAVEVFTHIAGRV